MQNGPQQANFPKLLLQIIFSLLNGTKNPLYFINIKATFAEWYLLLVNVREY
jgi:hypothetical protein